MVELDFFQKRYKIKSFLKEDYLGRLFVGEDTWGIIEGELLIRELTPLLGAPLNLENLNKIINLEHKNLVKIYDFFEENDKYYLVVERPAGKSLQEHLEELPRALPFEKEVTVILTQLLNILIYLHNHPGGPLYICELHLDWVYFVEEKEEIKVIPWGMLELLGFENVSLSGYRAPEKEVEKIINVYTDIFTLGVTMHSYITRRDPTQTPFLYPKVRGLNPYISLKIEKLIEKCLQNDFKKRYSSAEKILDDIHTPAYYKAEKTHIIHAEMPSCPPVKRYSKTFLGVILVLILLLSVIGLARLIYLNTTKGIKATGLGCKERGKEFYLKKEYIKAKPFLEKAIKINSKDFESIIYLENIKSLLSGRETLTIGVICPLSGTSKNLGIEVLKGAYLALKEIEEENENKSMFNIEIKDDKGDPRLSSLLAQELVDDTRVIGVVGGVLSSCALSAAKVFNQGRLVNITPSATTINLTNIGDYTFRLCPSDWIQGKVMASFINESLPGKNILVIYYPDTEYSLSLASSFLSFSRQYLNDRNIISMSLDKKHNNDLQLKFTNLSQPIDIALVCTYKEEGEKIIKKLKRTYPQAVIIGGDAFQPIQGESIDESLEILCFSYFYPDTEDKIFNRFLNLYRRNFSSKYLWLSLSALGYDATKLIMLAVIEEGKDREKVKEYLYKLGKVIPPYWGASGVLSFDSYGEAIRSWYVLKIKGNHYELIEKFLSLEK